MTIEEIRIALQARKWTQRELASMLHVHPVTLGLILTGKNKLTSQLEAHIELLLARKTEQLIFHKITLPDHIVARWVPGFDKLSEEERQKAVKTVIENAVQVLVRKGEEQFSDDERCNIRSFCTRFEGMPARTYEYNVDDEGGLLEAGDADWEEI